MRVDRCEHVSTFDCPVLYQYSEGIVLILNVLRFVFLFHYTTIIYTSIVPSDQSLKHKTKSGAPRPCQI